MGKTYGRKSLDVYKRQGSFSETLTQEQQESFDERWILQYDLMFGEPYLEDYVQEES